MSRKSKRYKAHSTYKGIRIETKTGKFLVQVRLKGKQFSKTFAKDRIVDAIKWMEEVKGGVRIVATKLEFDLICEQDFKGTTFKEVYERYVNEHISTLGTATKQNRMQNTSFFEPLFPVLISNFKPQIVAKHILNQKNQAEIIGNPRRFSFDQELKILKALCNWWREEDYTFINPVLKKHFKLGKIKEKVTRNKKMTTEEIKKFFLAISERPFWNDFAIIHFFCAGRVSEIAGLRKNSLDFLNRVIFIRDIIIWDKKTKHFLELKNCTKNGEDRLVYMNDIVFEILKRRASESAGEFIFAQRDGTPLSYRQIQNNYDWALRKAGLRGDYSGTHFMRHTMATITRLATGSLDAVQAVTGHKDQKLVQHYAGLDASKNKQAQIEVQKLLNF